MNLLAADSATNEAVLVAATFGLIALPNKAYPFVRQLRKTIYARGRPRKCGRIYSPTATITFAPALESRRTTPPKTQPPFPG